MTPTPLTLADLVSVDAYVSRTAGNAADGPYIMVEFNDFASGHQYLAVQYAAGYLPDDTPTVLHFDQLSTVHIEDNSTIAGVAGYSNSTLAAFLAANPLDSGQFLTAIRVGIGLQGGGDYSAETLNIDGVVVNASQSAPEPGTWSLFAIGAGLVGLARRYRR
jgi:hypothetical protein